MHSTYMEMKDQYTALGQTISYIDSCWPDVKKFIGKHQPRFILYLGCGSCYSLAASMAMAAQLNLKIPSIALPGGDFLLHSSSYASMLDGAMVIAISRSGSTSEVIAAVERIKAEKGTPVLSITCVVNSKLSTLSDMTLEMPWSFDKSVCQTRAATCLYMAGVLLMAKLAGNKTLADGFEQATAGGKQFMDGYEQQLKAIAGKPWTHAVVLADAELAGIGEGAALTFKEICQRQSNFYHLLDVRHGPIVIIDKNTLVIAALSDGSQYELDLLADIARKGAELVVYSDTPMDNLPEKATNISFGKRLPHAARGLPFVLIAQLMAYYKAMANGVNPDEPNGLTAWIKL